MRELVAHGHLQAIVVRISISRLMPASPLVWYPGNGTRNCALAAVLQIGGVPVHRELNSFVGVARSA